jgi:hypothetical protein
MEHNFHRQANNSFTTEEIRYTLRKPNFHYRVHKCQFLVSNLNGTPLLPPQSYLFKIHLNNILYFIFKRKLSKQSLLSCFPATVLYEFHIPCYMVLQPHRP